MHNLNTVRANQISSINSILGLLFSLIFTLLTISPAYAASPNCDDAHASTPILWPANHKMVDIKINGLGDSEVVIQCIKQDEPLNTNGDGNTEFDGINGSASNFLLRAERQGGGNGRVYHVGYTASNAQGQCSGIVQVSVPPSKKKSVTDDGPLYVSIENAALCDTVAENLPPAFISEPILQARIGNPYIYDVQANDPENDAISFSLAKAPEGLSIDASSGLINWSPTEDHLGEHSLEVIVTDSNGNSSNQIFTLNVLQPINHSVVISSEPITQAIAEQLYTYQVVASDPDGDTLQYSLGFHPQGMTISVEGAVTWTPTREQAGSHDVRVDVDDGRGGFVSQLYVVSVPVSNSKPVISSRSAPQTILASLYQYAVIASDTDGDTLSYSLTLAPIGMTIDPSTGIVTWTSEAGQSGSHEVIIEVNDGQGGISTQSFTLTVIIPNHNPEITSLPITNASADQGYFYQVSAEDTDGDSLQFSLGSSPTGMTIDASSGAITWLPTSSQVGEHNIIVNVSDNNNGIASQTFNIVVVQPNRAPEITSTPVSSVNENNLYYYQVTAIDLDGNTPLTYELIDSPQGMYIDSVTGLVEWLPNMWAIGSHNVTVKVSDNESLSVSQSFTLQVLNVNYAPSAEDINITLAEDNTAEITLLGSDLDGDNLSYIIVAQPSSGALTSSETVQVYQPNTNFNGTDSFSYKVYDGSLYSAIATVTITVTAVNDLPVAHEKTLEVDEGNSVAVLLTGFDTEQSSLTYNVTSQPSNGQLTGTAPNLVYQANASFIGTDNFTYKVNDGVIDSATATVTITVNDVNNPPDIISQPQMSAITSQLYKYNVEAIDKDNNDVLTYVLTTSPEGMTINSETGLIQWIPNALALGVQQVIVKVSDQQGLYTEQSFELTVLKPILMPSNQGKDFWLMVPDVGQSKRQLYISSDVDTTGTISFNYPRFEDVLFTVVAGQVTTIELPSVSRLSFDQITSRGIHISAQDDVVVYAMSHWTNQPDAYSILPTHALGTEYFALSYESSQNGSEFNVVATENDTVVTIKVTELTDRPATGQKLNAGDSYQITLQQGENYHFNYSDPKNYDASGTEVSANKAVAIFAGNHCAVVPFDVQACDRLIEQIPPVKLWGNKYLSAPLATRRGGDTFKILASENGTEVKINNQLVAVLNRGQSHEQLIEPASEITANYPILVAQFSNSDKFDENLRKLDANYYFESKINEVSDTYIDNYLIDMAPAPAINYVMLVVPNEAVQSVVIDGVAVEEGVFVVSSEVPEYSIAQISLAPDQHNISATLPFGVYKDIKGKFAAADPFMAILPSSEQFLNSYNFSSPMGLFSRHFINVIAPQNAINSVILDGELIQEQYFKQITGTDYFFAQLGVTAGNHTISSPSPIGLTVYGFDRYASYGYLGGTGVQSTQTVTTVDLALSSSSVPIGSELCIDVSINDIDQKSIARAAVNIEGVGVSHFKYKGFTDSKGYFKHCYTSLVEGDEVLTVTSGVQTTSVNVTWQGVDSTYNYPPNISSLPSLVIEKGTNYSYQVTAQDIDGDLIQYQLLSGPEQMVIDANTGLLEWPIASGEEYGISIQVIDSNGLRSKQDYMLRVNSSPQVTTEPIAEVEVGFSRNTLIKATDSDGDKVLYELVQAPVEVTLEREGSRMNYTGLAAGTYPITVLITDNRGGATYYQYDLLVKPYNSPPLFTNPDGYSLTGMVGQEITHDLAVVDPENDSFTYSTTFDVGMALDEATGIFSWTPNASQAGFSFTTVKVTDSKGKYNSQLLRFNISVNEAPTITSTSSLFVREGVNYSYQLLAQDKENEPLSYSLAESPLGMEIDANTGLLTWLPTDTGTFSISVAVSDGFNTTIQNWQLSVIASDALLSVSLQSDDKFVDDGSSVQVQSIVENAMSDVSYTLTVDGVAVSIDNSGVASVELVGIGEHQLIVTATDDTSSVQGELILYVIDPSDVTAPEVKLLSPKGNGNAYAKVTNLVDVQATIFDEAIQSYALRLWPVQDKASVTIVAQGNSNESNAVIGQLDPSTLLNGLYVLHLSAQDKSGNESTDSVLLKVSGDLKVGNFSITIEDLNIPLAGLPIRVTRTYDSRQKSENLAFGYGWSVGYQDIKIEASRTLGLAWQLKEYKSGPSGLLTTYCVEPIGVPEVIITLPSGDVESFEVNASPKCNEAVPLVDVNLVFNAKDNTQSTLVALNDNYGRLVEGNLVEKSSFTLPINPNRFKLTTRSGYEYFLDKNIGIEKVIDPNGNTLTYSSDGITHSSGKSVSFTHDLVGRITAITDPKGNVINYQYDVYGDLTVVTDVLTNNTSFSYNLNHGLLEIVDPLGKPLIKNIYNDAGRLVAQEDAQGNQTSFEHDLAGRQSVVTDRLNRSTVFYYDDNGNVTSQVDALTGVTSFTYDANNNQLSKTDALNNTVNYSYNDRGQELTIVDASGDTFTNSYDSVGNLLSISDPLLNTISTVIGAQGLASQVKDALGNISAYTFDEHGNKLTETNSLNDVTQFTYDVNGNVLNESSKRTLADGSIIDEVVTYEYDKQNRLVKTTDALNNISSVEYDLAGNQVAIVDAANRRTETDYDVYNRAVATRYHDGTSITKSYDVEGNLLTESDRNGNVTSFEYDKLNRLIKTTFADNSFSETEYDVVGQVIAEIDALGNRTSHDYDLTGRRVKTTDALSNVHSFAYDVDGNLISETDALSHTTSYSYDKLDRKVQTTFHNSSVVKTGYDAVSRRTASTDQANIVTNYSYDVLGRLTSVTDVEGNITRYSYDEAGNKLSQTDAEGRVTQWSYDSLGRVLSRTLPLGQVESFTYDAMGNRTTHTNFNGELISYGYDSSDRVNLITYAKDNSTESFSYDNNGNRLTATSSQGTWTYTYDSQNRLSTETKPSGEKLAYTYDANGNKTQLTVTYVDGAVRIEHSTYDVLNRLSTVTDADGNKTTYSYDAVGNRASVTHSNANITSYVYDELNRLTQLQDKQTDNTVIQQFDYTLDITGRRTQLVELSGRTSDFVYDNLYRLTSESISDVINGGYSAIYTFDKVGNRTQSIINGVTTDYTYDDNDRLTQTGGDFSNQEYSYDDNGSTLTKAIDSDVTTYTYNAKNKLTNANVTEGANTTELGYQYNVDGIRTQKVKNGTATNYLVDANREYAQVIAQTDDTNLVNVEYTFGDDLLSQKRNSTTSNYLYDGLGSTRALTDASGNVSNSYNYDAFGNLLNSTGDTENSYLFTGEQYDAELDNYYLRARYYDQGVGRFSQQDTYMGNSHDPVTLHKYLYANADPVRYVDPTGNMSLVSFSVATNIRTTLATLAVPAGQQTMRKVLWGEVKGFVKDELAEQVFGMIGEFVVQSMVNAVSTTPDIGQSAQSFGSSSHKKLEKIIDENVKDLNRYLRRFNARLETEIFRDQNGRRTNRGGKNRARGSMGIDVTVVNIKTDKVILSFDLKTGKAGTSKGKLTGYRKSHSNSPIIDVFVRRKK